MKPSYNWKRPYGIKIYRQLSCSKQTLTLFGFPILWIWWYLINVIPGTRRMHLSTILQQSRKTNNCKTKFCLYILIPYGLLIIRIRKSKKDRQHNGQQNKDKRRSIKHTYKTEDRLTRAPTKNRGWTRH
jgi:hypothetical protein